MLNYTRVCKALFNVNPKINHLIFTLLLLFVVDFVVVAFFLFLPPVFIDISLLTPQETS